MSCSKQIFIILICYFTSFVESAPADNEVEVTIRPAKDVGPIMQTLLTDIAKELISRSTSTTQGLKMNFTNMLILLVLKGILWGAGYMGATDYNKGRNADIPEESLITETEVLLLLSYLMGDQDHNFECLQRVACEDPEKAKDYISAATIIINTAKFIGIESSNEDKYHKLLEQLEEAVRHKQEGGVCEDKYSCPHNRNENKS